MEAHAYRHQDDGVGVMAVLWMRQVFCGLNGHDHLMQFGRDRLFLKCVTCGHESHGWELTETPPTHRISGDASRHMLVPPHLAGAHRVA
jgi:hypothetical protein